MSGPNQDQQPACIIPTSPLPAKPACVDAAPDSRCRRLFIGGLSWDTTDEKFRQYFEQFGQIEESMIMRDKMTGQSRGFGFLTFVSADPVQTVLSQSLELDGRQIDPKVAVRKEEMDKRNTAALPPREATDRKIFVGSISPEVTQESFKAYWETFGAIQEAVVMKGYGFVRFQEQETVDNVINHPEHIIMGHKVEPQRAVHRRGHERHRGPDRRRGDDGFAFRRPPPSDRLSSSRFAHHDYREAPTYSRAASRDPYDYHRPSIHDHQDRYGPYDDSRSAYDRRLMYESRYGPPPAAVVDHYETATTPSAHPGGSSYDQYAEYESPYVLTNGRHGYYADSPYPPEYPSGRSSSYAPASSVPDLYDGYADTRPTYSSNVDPYGPPPPPVAGGSYGGRDSYSSDHGRGPPPSSSYSSSRSPGGMGPPPRGSRYDPYARS